MFRSLQKVGAFKHVFRSYTASTFDYLKIDDSDKGYCILEMKKNPVNSLNLEMLNELIGAIDMVEKEESYRGLIITSKLPVFSAGLDILEMYQPKSDRLREFWLSFQEMKLRLFSSPLVVISAINGACPAGGCAIAFSSDYRIMADGKHTIGLNETLLGLAAPYWLADSLKLIVGHREAERMLALSILSTPQQALEKGMVDSVVPREELIEASEKHMKKWLKIPDVGRIPTKLSMRKGFIEEFRERKQEDLTTFMAGIQNANVQKALGAYIAALKKK